MLHKSLVPIQFITDAETVNQVDPSYNLRTSSVFTWHCTSPQIVCATINFNRREKRQQMIESLNMIWACSSYFLVELLRTVLKFQFKIAVVGEIRFNKVIHSWSKSKTSSWSNLFTLTYSERIPLGKITNYIVLLCVCFFFFFFLLLEIR